MILTTIGDEVGITLCEQIKSLKMVNVNYIELRKIDNKYLWEYTNEELLNYAKQLQDNKISVILIDTPIGKKKNSFNYEENSKLLKKYIEITKIFNSKYLRIFSDIGKQPTNESIREVLKEMLQETRKNNMEILIENEKDTYAESISLCSEIIKDIDGINILFDIENAYAKGYDILKEYDNNKENIKYFHIRDFSVKTMGYTYIGEGSIELEKLFEKLREDRYKWVVSLETMLPKYILTETRENIFEKSYNNFIKYGGINKNDIL